MKDVTKKRLVLLFLCLISGYSASLIPGRITITKTESVKFRVFWSLKPDFGNINKGDYIRFKKTINIPGCDGEPCNVVKRVGCTEGETLEKIEGRYHCQGQQICEQNINYKGTVFTYTGGIPRRKLFVIGDNINSYDSRYFGFINLEDIDAKLIPLF